MYHVLALEHTSDNRGSSTQAATKTPPYLYNNSTRWSFYSTFTMELFVRLHPFSKRVSGVGRHGLLTEEPTGVCGTFFRRMCLADMPPHLRNSSVSTIASSESPIRVAAIYLQ